MAGEATIRRDRFGIAHVTAPSAAVAFAAQGWVAAADRIWQMEWDRRRAVGRTAEVVGWQGAAEDALFRRLGLAEAARADAEALSAAAQEMIAAYADGVNAWLAAHGDALPEEFRFHPAPPEPWEPWHCLAAYKVRHIFMGSLGRKLWRGYVAATTGLDVMDVLRVDPMSGAAMVSGEGDAPDLRAGLAELADEPELMAALREVVAAGVADEPGSAAAAAAGSASGSASGAAAGSADDGSNSWALAGSRTASGAPLLAGDPHRGIEFPNVYQQCHIACDEFDAIGLAFPGVPGFPHFGHNSRVAWCITHGAADDTDVFIERFDDQLQPADADDPRIDWRRQQLTVAGGTPDGEPTVDVWCGSTPRGPVALGDPADGIALSITWTGLWGRDTTFDGLRPMLSAVSAAELNEAMRPWVVPVNNLLCADVDGHISYQTRGRLVDREPVTRWVPVPGEPRFTWRERDVVAFERLPNACDPASGVLVTANNRINDLGPFVTVDFSPPFRFERICELLDPLTAATADDMKRVHADVRSAAAPAICRAIVDLATRCADELAPQMLDRLARWDGEMGVESAEATLYAVIRRRWAEGVAARLGVERPSFGAPGWPRAADASQFVFVGASAMLAAGTWQVVDGLETREGAAAAVSACVDEALAELRQRLGDDVTQWAWGRVHRMASPHPLAAQVPAARHLHPPTDGIGGDSDTVRAASTVPETGERAVAASAARYVFDLADWDASGWVMPHGMSGVRGDPHDLDQRQAWLAAELLPMHYSERAVAAAAVSTETVSFGA